MQRPDVPKRATDDKTLERDTGRSRRAWFDLIDASGASGRSAIGKVLLAEKLDAWWISTLTVEHEVANSVTEKDGRPRGYSLCVTKSVAVSPTRAFDAFTSAGDLSAWFDKRATCDAREGGDIATAGGFRGTIKKLRPAKALVFSWDTPGFAEGSTVEVLFQPKGDKCGLVVNHTRVMARDDADAARAAWEQGLARLKSHLEG